MNTKERIMQIAVDKGLSRLAFLKKCSLRRGLLDSDKMDQSVSDKQLAAIFTAFPEVNLEWLLTGDGSMYKPTTTLPSNMVSLERYEAKVEECVRLRIELESTNKHGKK